MVFERFILIVDIVVKTFSIIFGAPFLRLSCITVQWRNFHGNVHLTPLGKNLTQNGAPERLMTLFTLQSSVIDPKM